MKRRLSGPFALLVLATAIAGGATPVHAQEPPDDAAAFGAFFDAAMVAQMDAHHLAGGVVVVVKDGAVMFQRGYGYADVEGQRAVDPETTMFRVGSVTKSFTATAVMQLVEEGRIDLGEDVNTYLDFRIPEAYGEPVTVAHLLTHTSGFEARWIGMWPDGEDGVSPLGEWLRDHRPARVRPPGTVVSYSNYGLSLAGYIVERVSGMPYADYVEQHILAPLGMTLSTASQPVPVPLQDNLSTGYEFGDGEFRARDFEWLNMTPAGVITSSAGDMARFMVAHLQYGLFEEARILGEESARLMQERHASNAEALNGIGYGFYEMHLGERRAIGHAGDTALFHSMLLLVPGDGLGVFIAFNSADGRAATRAIRDQFVARFLPSSGRLDPVPLDDRHRGLAGTYRLTNTAYSTVEKFTGLFGAYRVRIDNEALVLSTPAGDEMLPDRTTHFLPVASPNADELLFQEEGGGHLLAFRTDPRTGETYAFLDHAPVFSLERVAGHEDPRFHQLALAALLVVLLSGLLAVPVAHFVARRRNNATLALPARVARWTMGVLGAAALLLVAGLAIVVIRMDDLVAGHTTLLAVVLVLPLLIVAGSIAAAALTVFAWKDRFWGVAGRVHLSVVALSGLALAWFFNYWNLLGWRY